MTEPKPLAPTELRRACDPAELPFESTAELEPLERPLGQERAVEATHFAVALRRPGYNLFVLGPSGFGKHAFVRQILDRAAESRDVPPDVCYVYDFSAAPKPRALLVPAGRGRELSSDMDKLVEDLRAAIPAAFETDDFRAKLSRIEDELRARPEKVFREIEEQAKKSGIAMIRLPSGVGFAPLKNGEVLAPDEFEKLPEDERAVLEKTVAELQQKLQAGLRELPRWGKQAREKVRELNREVTSFAVDQLVDDVKQKYEDLPKVVNYLEAVRADVIENADAFRHDEEKGPLVELTGGKRPFQRYGVNLIVDNSAATGAPVIYDDRPAIDSLLGRVEHRAELGALVSDFTLIKGGSLHRANGGYLMLDLRQLLIHPHAWEALKRALFSREIRIESLGQMLGFSAGASLEPEPVPLDLKVVVIGDRYLFHLLAEVDADVGELFKVVADFDDRIDRTLENDLAFARLIATLALRDGLRPLGRDAVAAVLEQSARATGDSRKLSTRVRDLANLLHESEHYAGERSAELVSGADVQRALDARTRRQDRLRERLHEQILKDTLLIDTGGEKVGQVNGLSVLEFGGFAFGMPTRITATARVGDRKVVDIEREVELGGALHSKGVLILSSYFAARYTRHIPLSLSASLVFEQSYAGVEGDSASLAELCALISALSGAPVKQNIAMTGSVNQHGVVQAIGGVNEKIEGFFDICRARGLAGDQGVIIPVSNVPHLMLRPDVVAACAQGKFAVYPVQSVDDAVQVLTGLPAGESDEEGDFPEGTVNARVLEQLVQFAVIGESFGKLVKVSADDDDDPNGGQGPHESN
ncbi:MAG: AAA family ATPase [Polyangiaceae bacterium]|nr:AAA family ATPase [Polyangiaceae bacterium]